ncbi:fatty acyl-CoA reductase wat-like [Polistes fuscatus]|uniref:fatty acyl-CoA reductase wat-like n=1 Tax=Polistes fuscatus TaxID=30207 RepID=UPI001CA9351D|nr:fatty acyl-CoA reductase wat-like [Polistes fuscatus]
MNGLTGVVFGGFTGVLHTLYCNENFICDIIPADYVVNNIIAAAWDVAQERSIPQIINLSNSNNKYLPVNEEIPIYNVVSSVQKPITWGIIENYLQDHGLNYPSKNMLCGRKPRLLKIYRNIEKFKYVINFFTFNEWEFTNDKVLKLWDKLSVVDKHNFFFNVSDIDWDCFSDTYIKGLRVFLLNDPMETVEESKPFYRRIIAEWHFFATVHGKGLCDGLAGSVKRHAARASLQMENKKHILTQQDLHSLAIKNFTGVDFTFITNDDYLDKKMC